MVPFFAMFNVQKRKGVVHTSFHMMVKFKEGCFEFKTSTELATCRARYVHFITVGVVNISFVVVRHLAVVV